MKFKITLEFGIPEDVAILCELAEIIESEGHAPAEPTRLSEFLMNVYFGTMKLKGSPIIGTKIDDESKKQWRWVGEMCSRISQNIEESLKADANS